MRQLRYLISGLAVVALWGICLQLIALRNHPQEPQRLNPDANARPLGKSRITESNVRPASYATTTNTDEPVEITEIRDTSTGLIWTAPMLNGPVWLKQTQIEVKFNNTSATSAQLILDQGNPQQAALTATSTVRFSIPDGALPKKHLDLVLNGNELTVRLQTQPTAKSVELVIDGPLDLPREPSLISIRLASTYPFQPAVPTDFRVFANAASSLTFRVSQPLQGHRIRFVEYEDTSKKVLSVSPAVSVGGDGYFEIGHVFPANASADRGYYFVASSLNETITFSQAIKIQIKDDSVPAPLAREFTLQKVSHLTKDTTTSSSSNLPVVQTTRQFADPTLTISSTYQPSATGASLAWQLLINGKPATAPEFVKAPGALTVLPGLELIEGRNELQARFYKGEQTLATLPLGTLQVATNGFRVVNITPKDFGQTLGADQIAIEFTRQLELPANSASWVTTVQNAIKLERLIGSAGSDATADVRIAEVSTSGNTLLLKPASQTAAGVYRLSIDGMKLNDLHHNVLEDADGRTGNVIVQMLGTSTGPAGSVAPLVPGVTRGQAPIVDYPQFIEPTKQSKGFNPNDRVETRVARLYFYRDAHRVAQILNRRTQSYNRHDVTMRRQFADKARQEAESLTTQRQISERRAVEMAQRSRELQNRLSDAQRTMDFSLRQMQQLALSSPPPGVSPEAFQATQVQQLSQLQAAARDAASQVRDLEGQLRVARDTEVASNEQMQQAQRGEELARAEQFRLETAAAHADPDTFAAGDPTNIDPVSQVSISVIGEGLLHLRGPLRGVNQVRIMIDQMDAPCGQVRVNIHSTQINGEKADRMEVVANRIQTYIDQARFLTVQSGEMLRKSVVQAAAARAEESRGLYPGQTQADRDQRYLYAFFGRDFSDELRAMDSELLRTGNKLLSLHSMDVTSLSSALMLMALANNSTRQAILDEFDRLLQSDLAMAEQQFVQNSIGCCTGGCKPGCKRHQQAPPICHLSGNATFTSLRGFFDTHLAYDETMSPLQREVIRLAQILKARLVTELEYKQRVMERALIEERMDDAIDGVARLQREKETQSKLIEARKALFDARAIVVPTVTRTSTAIAAPMQNVNALRTVLDDLGTVLLRSLGQGNKTNPTLLDAQSTVKRFEGRRRDEALATSTFPSEIMAAENLQSSFRLFVFPLQDGQSVDCSIVIYVRRNDWESLQGRFRRVVEALNDIKDPLKRFSSDELVTTEIDNALAIIGELPYVHNLPNQGQQRDWLPVATVDQAERLILALEPLVRRAERLQALVSNIQKSQDAFLAAFARFEENAEGRATRVERAAEVLRLWGEFESQVRTLTEASKNQIALNLQNDLKKAQTELNGWMLAVSQLDAAYSLAQDARRPLDHKKFLDMLVDDLEEKYIELLEGTRAHTANIDNYLKRLTTALDDDFNTQYYYPVFRLVREASQFRDVQFGQTETTTVLANNRELGKVAPSATMEFDLPKRDILINEGLNAALATYNDLGALVTDPNLMALAKLNSGQNPASPPAGSLGGYGAVRSVYPGLNTDVSGRLIAQNAGSGPEFESNVEKLIPDPAIYKFETGTGYEIRPVIAPDGQAMVFHFNYLYTTQVREPVRADEKHLGRIKQHFVDTDVQLSNFELREVTRYTVALKAARTAKGVPLLEDLPVVGALWRPLPSDEKSLQQNIIMAQATIFPTLFDLMGLRWAPAVADLDPLRLSNREFLVRSRNQHLQNRVYGSSSASVDDFLRIPHEVRRPDLYGSQETIPSIHPNGYRGPGMDLEVSSMREGFNPEAGYTPPGYIPGASAEGAIYLPNRSGNGYDQLPPGEASLSISTDQPPRVQLPSPPSLRDADGWESKRVK